MSWQTASVIAACGLLVGMRGTSIVLRYALRRRVFDVPNERSLHAVATPRGGGLSIMVAVCGGCIALGAMGLVSWRVAVAVVIGGGLVGITGWIDDHRPLSARTRLFAQLAAALVAVIAMGGLPGIGLGATEVSLGWGGVPLAVLGIVWMTNLYNFMDGVDGLAGGFAVLVGALGAAMLATVGEPGVAAISLLTAAASAGFLRWNWPPARIFMGDVGSGFLGFTYGVLAVASERQVTGMLILWVILLGPFVFDGTFTLARRALRGHNPTSPHRSHAYQRLVQSGWSHRTVTVVFLGLSFIVGLAATNAVRSRAWQLPALASALILLCVAYGAVERRRPM